MSAAKHTPGPWVGQTGHRTSLIRGIHARDGRLVIRFGGIAAPTSDEGQANALLIAAAPELLEALAGLLKNHTQLVMCGDCGSWDVETEDEVIAARAAIAKATEGGAA